MTYPREHVGTAYDQRDNVQQDQRQSPMNVQRHRHASDAHTQDRDHPREFETQTRMQFIDVTEGEILSESCGTSKFLLEYVCRERLVGVEVRYALNRQSSLIRY